MAPAQHAPAPAPAKKAKGKKAADPTEQQKQIQAKIAQLEQDAAGDKEQELEIGALTPSSEACGKWGCCGLSCARTGALERSGRLLASPNLLVQRVPR
jgi:hypothetical protein